MKKQTKRSTTHKNYFTSKLLYLRIFTVIAFVVTCGLVVNHQASADRGGGDPYNFGRGIVTISFVNGYSSQYDAAKRKLNKLDIPATYFMPTDALNTPGRMTTSNVRSLKAMGHNVGNMTSSDTTLMGLPQAEVVSRYKDAQDWFTAQVGVTPKFCLYPQSPYQNDPYGGDDTIIEVPPVILKAVKDPALDFSGCVMRAGGMMFKESFNPWRLKGGDLPSTVTIVEMEHMLNNVIGARTWVNLTFTQIGDKVNPDDTVVSQDLFDQTMDYLAYRRGTHQLNVVDLQSALQLTKVQYR